MYVQIDGKTDVRSGWREKGMDGFERGMDGCWLDGWRDELQGGRDGWMDASPVKERISVCRRKRDFHSANR